MTTLLIIKNITNNINILLPFSSTIYIQLMIAFILAFLVITIPAISWKIDTTQTNQIAQPSISSLILEEALFVSKTDHTSSYYSLSLGNQTFGENESLIISVLSRQKSFASIFVNVIQNENNDQDLSQLLPSAQNAQYTCSDANLLSCPLFEIKKESTVYIAVLMRESVEYILYADKQEIETVSVFKENQNPLFYNLEFDNNFAKLIQLDLTTSNNLTDKQLVVSGQHLLLGDFKTQKIFIMTAGTKQISSNVTQMDQKYGSRSLNALSQQIKLSASTNSTYYILITGESELKINLEFWVSSSQIKVFQEVQYIYDLSMTSFVKQINEFTFDPTSEMSKDQDNNFIVYLQKLRGEGIMAVTACTFSYNFTEKYGQSAFITIPRNILTCTDLTIRINLVDVLWQIGVRITIQTYLPEAGITDTLFFGETLIQVIDPKNDINCSNFVVEEISSELDEQNMLLIYSAGSSSKEFSFNSCIFDEHSNETECESTKFTATDIQEEYLYHIDNINENELSICYNNSNKISNNYFSVLTLPYPQIKTLEIGEQTPFLISAGQTLLYQINVPQVKSSNSSLEVRATLINGDILFYKDCIVFPHSNLESNENEFCVADDDSSLWNYSASYALKQSLNLSVFTFGIQGLAQSVGLLQVYIDDNSPAPQPTPPTPDPTPQPVYLSDGVNNLSISPNSKTILIYQSHIIPYKIFSSQIPSNLCVEMFESQASMQNNDTCTNKIISLSASYNLNAIYFRITNNNANSSNLQINVTVPQFILQENKSVILSCVSACYANIQAKIKLRATVLVSGPGFINDTDGEKVKSVSLKSNAYLNASLPDGGNLYIQMDSDLNVLSWDSTRIIMVKSQARMIAPIGKYSSFDTLFINSMGTVFKAYWKFFAINQTESNLANYIYPNSSDSLLYQSPKFAELAVSLILPTMQSNNNNFPNQCFESIYLQCFMAISLFEEDSDSIFSILNNYYEVTTRSQIRYLPLNTPTIMSNQFGNSYFGALILQNTQQGYNLQQSNWDLFQLTQDKVTINYLSNCGNMQSKLIKNTFGINQQAQKEKQPSYLQVSTLEPCAYSVVITSCPLPLISSGVPVQLYFNSSLVYTGLFSPSSASSEINLNIWISPFSFDSEDKDKIVTEMNVYIYKLPDQQNCIASKNNLVGNFSVQLNNYQKIYLTNSKTIPKIFFNRSDDGKLFLIEIQAFKPIQYIHRQIKIFMLAQQSNKLPMIPFDFQVMPFQIPHSQNHVSFIHHTTVESFSFCYYQFLSTDILYKIRTIVTTGGKIINNSTQSSQSQCFIINNPYIDQGQGESQQVTAFNITLTSPQIQTDQLSIVYVDFAQDTQAFTIAQHGIVEVHSNKMTKNSPSSLLNRCFSYDILLGRGVDMIYYFKEPTTREDAIFAIGIADSQDFTTEEKLIINQRDGSLLGYRAEMVTEGLMSQLYTCIQTNLDFYLAVVKPGQISGNHMVILEEETIVRTFIKSVSQVQLYKYISLSNFSNPSTQRLLQSASDEPNYGYLLTQITQCSNFNSNLTLLGAEDATDIESGAIAQFLQTFEKYNIKLGLSKLSHEGEFYLGVKSASDEPINYTLKSYRLQNNTIPHLNWKMTGEYIEKTQMPNNNYLVVQLPVIKRALNSTTPPTSIKYSVHIVDQQNMSLGSFIDQVNAARCPSIQNQIDEIRMYNLSIENPLTTPTFKIRVKDLPSRNVSIIASVTIKQTPDSMPFTFFYKQDEMELDQPNGDDDGNSSKGFNLGLLFLILAILIFLVLLTKFIYKVVKQRKSRNNIEFQMSEPSRPQPQAQPQTVNNRYQYGEFVEETVVQ